MKEEIKMNEKEKKLKIFKIVAKEYIKNLIEKILLIIAAIIWIPLLFFLILISFDIIGVKLTIIIIFVLLSLLTIIVETNKRIKKD